MRGKNKERQFFLHLHPVPLPQGEREPQAAGLDITELGRQNPLGSGLHSLSLYALWRELKSLRYSNFSVIFR